MTSTQVGTIVFQHDSFVETVIASIHPVTLVECKEGETVKLYRVEWYDFTGSFCHAVRYSKPEAQELYGQKCIRYSTISPNPKQ